MHILQRALLEQLLVYFHLVRGAQIVRHLDKDNTVLQSFRLLVAHKGLVLVFVGMADDHFIGVDHAETPGFDVLFLAEREQHIQKFFIGFEHFYEFHNSPVGDIEFTVEAICSRIAFYTDFTDGGEVDASDQFADVL